jgi:hypothetical protein
VVKNRTMLPTNIFFPIFILFLLLFLPGKTR